MLAPDAGVCGTPKTRIPERAGAIVNPNPYKGFDTARTREVRKEFEQNENEWVAKNALPCILHP
jgi:hypothetical protein